MDLNLEVGNNSIIGKNYAIEFIDFMLGSRSILKLLFTVFVSAFIQI